MNLTQLSLLVSTLRQYAHCRHGAPACFCYKEARIALELLGLEW